MDRSRVRELHSLQPIANLGSILEHGVLSHDRAKKVRHISAASASVQAGRAAKSVPGGRRLHEYACLFFDARTPMMYSLLPHIDKLVVLSIDPAVIGIEGVVVTDGNARSTRTRFMAPAAGIATLDEAFLFAQYWTDEDAAKRDEKARRRAAEVLVPDRVAPAMIRGAYAANRATKEAVDALGLDITVTVNAYLFFQPSQPPTGRLPA